MKYTGVIFDFNGTLFWDTGLHNEAWQIFLDKYNLHLSDEKIKNFGEVRNIIDEN